MSHVAWGGFCYRFHPRWSKFSTIVQLGPKVFLKNIFFFKVVIFNPQKKYKKFFLVIFKQRKKFCASLMLIFCTYRLGKENNF